MAETAKAKKERQKKRRRSPKADEYGAYVMSIENWEWSFSFGIDQTRFREGPYMDFRHLHLRGKLIVPSRIKAETVEVILMPRAIARDERDSEPKSVGSVSFHRGRFEGLLTMPNDALPSVLQMLIAGKFRFIDMRGTRMRYRSGSITGYALEMDKDEEDMPPDD